MKGRYGRRQLPMEPNDIDECEEPSFGGWSPRARIGTLRVMDTPITIPSMCLICGAPTEWVHLGGPLFEKRNVFFIRPGCTLCIITTRCEDCFSVEDRP